MEAGQEGRIYAGLKPSTTEATLRGAIASGTVEKFLASFEARPGDGVLVEAGTVHALSDVVVFEVQENSDVTFRLYDWHHVDARTGQLRPLQIEQAMACIKFDQHVDVWKAHIVDTTENLRHNLGRTFSAIDSDFQTLGGVIALI